MEMANANVLISSSCLCGVWWGVVSENKLVRLFRLFSPSSSALGSLDEEGGGDRVLAEEEPPHVAESPPRCAPSLGNLRCCGRAGVNTAEPFLKGWCFPPTQDS